MALTAEQRKEYIDNAGGACPACEGLCLMGNGLNFEGGHIWQRIECGDCGETWVDVYRLVAAVDEILDGYEEAAAHG